MQVVSQTFTSAQTDTVLVSAGNSRLRVAGAVFTAHADNTTAPLMRVSLGAQTIIEHPGVPAGGGLAVAGFDVHRGQGDDLTFTCGEPTGGSVSVMVAYTQ